MFNEEEDDKNPLEDVMNEDDEDEEAEDPLSDLGIGDDDE